MKLKRIYFDMDGVLAEWRTDVEHPEVLYEKGYFLDLPPVYNVCEAARLLQADPAIDVQILSAYFADSRYALQEKQEWIRRYIPEIPEKQWNFVPCGTDKNLIRESDDEFLLDDYSVNLHSWGDRGIKLLNGVNFTKGTWKGNRISVKRDPVSMYKAISMIMDGASIKD